MRIRRVLALVSIAAVLAATGWSGCSRTDSVEPEGSGGAKTAAVEACGELIDCAASCAGATACAKTPATGSACAEAPAAETASVTPSADSAPIATTTACEHAADCPVAKDGKCPGQGECSCPHEGPCTARKAEAPCAVPSGGCPGRASCPKSGT